MHLRHALLDSHGLLDLEAMGAAALGSAHPEAAQQRRRLAVLGSLQPLLRDLQPAAAGGSWEGDGGGGSGSGSSVWSSHSNASAAADDRGREQQLARQVAAHWRELLSSMPTGVAEDEALLAADASKPPYSSGGGGTQRLGPRLRAAIEARLERKRLLHTGVEALQRYLGLLA